MVELKTMSETKFATWHKQIWELYFQELVQSGMSEADAKKNVESNVESSMPGGVLQPGNTVFEVFHEGDPIGVVWLWQNGSEWFIYDIDLLEEVRGRGLGRQTMKAIEQHVRSQGGTAIGLSVFGFNQVARNLYESEGYEVTRLSMKKVLGK